MSDQMKPLIAAVAERSLSAEEAERAFGLLFDGEATDAQIGGMLMAKFAGVILERIGSYGPIFAVASCAYLVALLTIHLIIPRYQVVASAGTVDQGA